MLFAFLVEIQHEQLLQALDVIPYFPRRTTPTNCETLPLKRVASYKYLALTITDGLDQKSSLGFFDIQLLGNKERTEDKGCKKTAGDNPLTVSSCSTFNYL